MQNLIKSEIRVATQNIAINGNPQTLGKLISELNAYYPYPHPGFRGYSINLPNTKYHTNSTPFIGDFNIQEQRDAHLHTNEITNLCWRTPNGNLLTEPLSNIISITLIA